MGEVEKNDPSGLAGESVMKMNDILYPLLVLLGLFAILLLWSYFRKVSGQKKAESGVDKQLLLDAVAKALPGESGYTVAYGHRVRTRGGSKVTTTTYSFYALAFDEERLWVMDLKRSGKTLTLSQPRLICAENLGKIAMWEKESKGELKGIDLTLYSLEGKVLLDCQVETQSIRKDRHYPLNINQEAEVQRFCQVAKHLNAAAAQAHPEAEQQMTETFLRQTNTGNIIVAVAALVCGLFSSMMGIVLGIMSLLMAIWAKKAGGKPSITVIILSLLTLALCGVRICVQIYFLTI